MKEDGCGGIGEPKGKLATAEAVEVVSGGSHIVIWSERKSEAKVQDC